MTEEECERRVEAACDAAIRVAMFAFVFCAGVVLAAVMVCREQRAKAPVFAGPGEEADEKR